jgi:hypothetical protein
MSNRSTGGTIMTMSRQEIIEDLEAHIRKLGGEPSEWAVGTAPDGRGPFFRHHLEADAGDGLVYREAISRHAALAIRNHFFKDWGLELDLDDVPEPGNIVFVYRKTAPTPQQPIRADTIFHKLA